MTDSRSVNQEPAKELEVDLLGLARSMFGRKRLFAVMITGAFVLGYSAFKLLPVRYEAHVTFAFQEQSGGNSRLQQLAALTGGLGLRPKGSPFVAHLETFAKSREVTSRLRESRFGDSTLQQILLGPDLGPGQTDTAHSFHSNLLSRYELIKEADIYKLSAEYKSPEMAEFLAKSVFAAISDLLEEKRRLGIRKKMEFIDTLANGYRLQYESTSNRLKKFQLENLDITSPDLVQKKGQILFQLKLDEEKYLMSVKEKEEMRIEYQQSEEPLVVIEDAYLPRSPEFPSKFKCIFTAISLSFLIFLVLVGVLDRPKWIRIG